MPKLYPKREAAAALHDAGYWVVPCNGKVATKKDWPNERVDREELVETLAIAPKLDVAIVLGPCRLCDVEYDNGEAGEAKLLELFGGELPETPTWDSPRGRHRLFVIPDGTELKTTNIGGVEFRSGNRTAVVPPSAGRKYLPGLSLEEVEPAELPAHVVARLRASAPPPTTISAGDEILEGKRNDTLFEKGCALRELGLAEGTILAALLDVNQRQCQPPLPEAEVRSIAHSAATSEKPKIGFLVRLLGDIELWHDKNNDPFATVPQGEHKENWKIGKRVRAFKRWLAKLHYDATGGTLSDTDLGEIAALLEGKAVFDGPQYEVWRRVAEHEGKFYLDLCDDEWRAIEIDENCWRVVSNPPVKFFRARAMTSLPMPMQPAEGETLQSLLGPFLNLRPTSWPLVAAWLVAALRPRGPYPVLKLLGEQGSAKTTTARVLRNLIDPNAAPVRAEPRDTRDMMIAANNGWVLCLDNLSVVKTDLSDALCRMSTGGGFATRTLYTDEDETIFDATRPVILTSIEEIGTRSDLLERSLVIELPAILESARRAEKQFWSEFEKVRPRILGALLNAVSGGIRRLPDVEQAADAELSRLADFEQWCRAAEQSLRLAPGEFAEAYRANRESAVQTTLEGAPVLAALLKYLKNNPNVRMTAADLLKKLALVDHDASLQKTWPKTPNWFSNILKRSAPALRQIGITAEQRTEKNQKLWVITGPSATSAILQHSQSNATARKPATKPTSKFVRKMQEKGVQL